MHPLNMRKERMINLNKQNSKHNRFYRQSAIAIIILLSIATAQTIVWQHQSEFQAHASFVNLPPMTLTVVALNGTQVVLDETDIGNLTSYRAYGGYKNQLGILKGLGNYTGVPISTFCEMVGGIRNGYNVRIIASDGYTKIMTYAEVNGDFITYNNVTGEQVQHNQTLTPILAYHYNDLNLPSSDGPLRVAIVGPEGLCTGSTYWVKKVVRLEIHATLQPMNLTVVAPNGAELTLNETAVSLLPALRDVGARRNSLGVVSGLGNYTGPSLNAFCDLVGGMTNDTVLRVTAADTTVKKLTYAEVNGAFTTYNMTGQPVPHNQSLTPILAYHFNDANLSLTDGPLRLAIVGPEGLATTSSYWVKQVVKLEIKYIHDIALTNIAAPKTVLCQGFSMPINVTATNQGDQTETFNVTLNVNTTTVEKREVTLTSGSSTIITFVWNATDFDKGNYTLNAHATLIEGETDTADNSITDGWVIVSMPGDITGSPSGYPDGKVDMKDISAAAKLFGVNYPDARYKSNCDIIYDLKIDMKDISFIAKRFGQIDP
jgi:hypothetical protein